MEDNAFGEWPEQQERLERYWDRREDLERAEQAAQRVLDNPPPEGLHNDNFDEFFEVEQTDHGPQLRVSVEANLDVSREFVPCDRTSGEAGILDRVQESLDTRE